MKKVNHLNSVLIEGNVLNFQKEYNDGVCYAQLRIANNIEGTIEKFLIKIKGELAEITLYRIVLHERIKVLGVLRNNQDNIYISAQQIKFNHLN